METDVKRRQLRALEMVKRGAYDFALTVRPLYHFLGWTWKNDKHPPMANEIAAVVVNLANDLQENVRAGNGHWSISSGGLSVEVDEESAGVAFTAVEREYDPDWEG